MKAALLIDITLSHVEVLAALHGESFDQGWSASSFATTLGMPGAYGFLAMESDVGAEPLAFVLFRSGGGEAEVLSIATRPAYRGQGLAHHLMVAGLKLAEDLKVETMFLEVAADNPSAIALYRGLGFTQTGRRKKYYTRAHAQRVDAVVMSRRLSG